DAALANYAVHTPHFGHSAQLRFDLLRGRVGRVQRGRRGHRKGDVELALITVGKEVESDEAEHQHTNSGREARQANCDDSPPPGQRPAQQAFVSALESIEARVPRATEAR